MTDKIDGEVFITNIFADTETIRIRGVEETIYLTAEVNESAMIGTGPANVHIYRDADGDLVMSKYKVIADRRVIVGEEPDKPLFEWQVVKEARRQLGFATNAGERRAAQLLDGLLAAHPEADIDTGQLVNREGATMEHVVYHAAMIAAERFNPNPADPGWASEMHEDALREACLDYVQAFLARRTHA